MYIETCVNIDAAVDVDVHAHRDQAGNVWGLSVGDSSQEIRRDTQL